MQYTYFYIHTNVRINLRYIYIHIYIHMYVRIYTIVRQPISYLGWSDVDLFLIFLFINFTGESKMS